MLGFLTLFLAFSSGRVLAQGGPCSEIQFSFENPDPCLWRLQVANSNDACYRNLRLILDSGTFTGWNTGAGWTGTQISPTEITLEHISGIIPFGASTPIGFTITPGISPTVYFLWDNVCAMVSCESGLAIEACTIVADATIVGVKYRECGQLPFTNQATVEGWPIYLENIDGIVLDSALTDATGNYAFYDLLPGSYIVKEAVKPGWTANVPPSGQSIVNLSQSEVETRNFGNCPPCSCDLIYMDVAQQPGGVDTGAYCISVFNDGATCFPFVTLTLTSGQLANLNLTAGWTAQPVGLNVVRLIPPNGSVPVGASSPGCFSIVGASTQTFNLSVAYGVAPNQVLCNRQFSFTVPPPPPPVTDCCPAGSIAGPEFVVNGDFNVTNPVSFTFGFVTDYAYIFPPGGAMSSGNNAILNQAQAYTVNNQWICPGVTGPGDTYLAVDGNTTPGRAAWKVQVPVTPGTEYDFCAFARNMVRPDQNFTDPQVELWIKDGTNPTMMVAQMTLPEIPGMWHKISAAWTATSTSLILEIRSGVTAGLGNDFAIDKVSFRTCMPATQCSCDSIQLSVQQIGNFVDICCYRLDVQNSSSNCFPDITLQVDAGLVITSTTPLFPWTLASQGTQGLVLSHPSGVVPAGVYAPLEFCVASGSVHNIFVSTNYTDPAGNRVYCDKFFTYTCLASDTCVCKPSTVTINHDNGSVTLNCNTNPLPIIPCPTGPINISSDFGCMDALGNQCPTDPTIWTLNGPNGLVQQGVFTAGSPLNWSFPAGLFTTQGVYSLRMTTLCQGQTDSCVCRVFWKIECDTCSCDDSSWDMEIRFGGALNQPVHCGDVVPVPSNGFFVLYTSFLCQGPPGCMPAYVQWQLNGPNIVTGGAEQALPGFTIPAVSPANFTDPGIYTLQMWGICGTDTCHCHITFCVEPPPPVVNDTSICRTLTSAYIPLIDCPVGCTISQVQWFVKPCSASTWPTVPYQVSGAGPGLNCSNLLLLPYKYPGETCLQVYAVIDLAPGCCVSQLTSNIATITLCDPISCTISNPNPAFCDVTSALQPLSVSLSSTSCNPTMEWYNYNNVLVSTALTYTPPNFSFPAGSTACFHDFVFTVKVKGICGTSTCTTSIRIYNSNADNGDLIMNPIEVPPPFCPGEDFTLEYIDKCSGPPPMWTWYSSTVSGTSGFTPLSGAGTINQFWNTNQLYQTTWYMVESYNGVCPLPKQEVYKIEIKDPLTIVNFTAVADPCADQYVNLMVDFTPSPASAGCAYVVEWYWNGNPIGTSTSASSPVNYTFFNPGVTSLAGVYSAVVKDNCCPGSAKTWPVFIDATCVPVIGGPCFICGYGPVTLVGEMILPPQDPCPNISGCSFQWYEVISGNWVPITGSTGLSINTNHGGTYIFESNCNGCIRHDVHTVKQCGGTDCVTSDHEAPLPVGLEVQLFPNPTSGNFTLKIEPTPLQNGRVEIVRLDGQVLLSETLTGNQSEYAISLDRLSTGLYFVRLFEGDFLLWKGKIVKAE